MGAASGAWAGGGGEAREAGLWVGMRQVRISNYKTLRSPRWERGVCRVSKGHSAGSNYYQHLYVNALPVADIVLRALLVSIKGSMKVGSIIFSKVTGQRSQSRESTRDDKWLHSPRILDQRWSWALHVDCLG